MKILIEAIFLALLSKALAYPSLYNGYRICTGPDKALGMHKAPVMNPDITFTLEAGGAEATEFIPGQDHMIAINCFGFGVGEPCNVWIHVTAGTVDASDPTATPPGLSQAAVCPQAAYSVKPVTQHVAKWMAPAQGECVNVTATQAAEVTGAYNVNSVKFCPGGGGGGAAGGAPSPPTGNSTAQPPLAPTPPPTPPLIPPVAPAPPPSFPAPPPTAPTPPTPPPPTINPPSLFPAPPPSSSTPPVAPPANGTAPATPSLPDIFGPPGPSVAPAQPPAQPPASPAPPPLPSSPPPNPLFAQPPTATAPPPQVNASSPTPSPLLPGTQPPSAAPMPLKPPPNPFIAPPPQNSTPPTVPAPPLPPLPPPSTPSPGNLRGNPTPPPGAGGTAINRWKSFYSTVMQN